MKQQGKPVTKRHVFYLPGYDPMPPRRYREIYRRESARQGGISGYEINVAALPGQDRYQWQVDAEMNGRKTRTIVEFLPWNDLVQASMKTSIPRTYWLMFRTFWLYLTSGALLGLTRLRAVAMIAVLYPVALLLGQLLLAVLLAWGMVALIHGWPGWIVGSALAALVLIGFRRVDQRLYAYYLMHLYTYCALNARAYPPDMRTRLDGFKARIRAALSSGNDEVLVVGHSIGAQLAVDILAELERESLPVGSSLSLLTLGQAIPMIAYLPDAAKLRHNLRDLGRSKMVTWVDVSAPNDGACFALCDPVATCGAGDSGPLVLSGSFSQTMLPERYKAEKNRFFDQHFQYLKAFERPRLYDYFAITAGPLTLAERFDGVAHSPSRRVRCFVNHASVQDA